MGKIAIVTDSVSCVPKELVERYDIHIVPVVLIWNGKEFRDGVDITPMEVYRRMREEDFFPTLSAPSVGDFLRVYARLSRKVEAIVSIHVSSVLSATYSAALTASKMVNGVTIQVMDSLTATTGQGFVVLEAARAAAEGRNLQEVIKRAREVRPKVTVLVAIDTLKYLPRTGRIPALAALIGSLLKIKPILHIAKDGRAYVLEKPRTKARAVRRMLEIMEERVGSRPVHAAVMHADALEEAKRLRDEVASCFDCVELYITEFTPVMGAATGPGVIGLTFWAE